MPRKFTIRFASAFHGDPLNLLRRLNSQHE